MTYRDAVEAYIQARASVAARNTVRNHRRNADHLAAYYGQPPSLATVADDQWLASYAENRAKQRLKNGKAISQNTVRSELSSILAVLHWGRKKGWCEHCDYEPPGRIERAPRALSLAEVDRLLTTAAKMTGDHAGVPAAVRYTAFVMLTLCTGERIGAVAQVRWRDFEAGFVYFRADTRKGGRREVCRGLTAAVLETLDILRQYQEPEPFAWTLDRSFYPYWHAIRIAAELPEWLTPHKLRATAATHCATVAEAQQLLDHSSARITVRHYIDPRARGDKMVPESLAKVLAKPRRTWRQRLGWAG